MLWIPHVLDGKANVLATASLETSLVLYPKQKFTSHIHGIDFPSASG